METGITTAALDSNPPDRYVTLRRMLGVSSFGLNQIVLAPGQRGRIHAHERQEEVYVVMEGTLTLATGQDAATDIPAGTAVRVGPEVKRQLVNRGPGPLVLLAIGGAEAHNGRDGLAYASWDDSTAVPPADVPLPDDLPAEALRR